MTQDNILVSPSTSACPKPGASKTPAFRPSDLGDTPPLGSAPVSGAPFGVPPNISFVGVPSRQRLGLRSSSTAAQLSPRKNAFHPRGTLPVPRTRIFFRHLFPRTLPLWIFVIPLSFGFLSFVISFPFLPSRKP